MEKVNLHSWYLLVIGERVAWRNALNRRALQTPTRNARRNVERAITRLNREILDLVTNAIKADVDPDDIMAITHADEFANA